VSRTTREWALEKLDAALNSQNRSIEYVNAVREKYDTPGYEDIALAIYSIQEIQIAVAESLATARSAFP